jgi:protein O-GlcNAc transferase
MIRAERDFGRNFPAIMTAQPPPDPHDPLQAVRAPLQAGRYADAAALLERHLHAQPQDARGWALLGHALRGLGRVEDAARALQRALQLRPDYPSARLELARLLLAQGRERDALVQLRQGLALAPHAPELRWELAQGEAGQNPQRALDTLQPLLKSHPQQLELRVFDAELRLRLDVETGLDTGLDAFSRLLDAGPAAVAAVEGVLLAQISSEAPLPQRVGLARLLAQRAPNAPRWLALAQQLQLAGDFAAGRQAVQSALACDPQFLPARWARFQLPPSPAPASEAALARYRDDWDAGVAAFEAIDFRAAVNREQIWGCVGQCTAFHRHYLGDEVALQPRYGRLVRRMMAQLDPGEAPRALRSERRRIGFCSAYFREHTVARLFVPLIEALDRSRFDLYVFSLDDLDDRWSQRLQAITRFDGRSADAPTWRDRIHDAALDVLVYPEIGMHPLTQGLAALRLAPVQAAMWGHPVTTGMDSIDLMLGADALEPEDAAQRYTERLVRLPGLGHGLRDADLPQPLAPELGTMPADAIELVCPQTVFKLLPQQDLLFARILAQVPQARLHLLVDQRAPVRDWLRERMTPTLRAAGAEPERQLLMHGFLDHARYLGLAQRFVLGLDSIGWSGGMSALDLLAQGLPIVTLPGVSMRSRQTAALLRHLDLPELIARDEDDYVQKAIALATDAGLCAELSLQLRVRRERLFGDIATARSFNTLFATLQRAADGALQFQL